MITGLELLENIKVAEEKYDCVLRHSAIEVLIQEIAKNYRKGVNFKNILDAAVAGRTSNESEQHAYKFVIGKVFARRRHETAITS